jgi:hypothetical protein
MPFPGIPAGAAGAALGGQIQQQAKQPQENDQKQGAILNPMMPPPPVYTTPAGDTRNSISPPVAELRVRSQQPHLPNDAPPQRDPSPTPLDLMGSDDASWGPDNDDIDMMNMLKMDMYAGGSTQEVGIGEDLNDDGDVFGDSYLSMLSDDDFLDAFGGGSGFVDESSGSSERSRVNGTFSFPLG